MRSRSEHITKLPILKKGRNILSRKDPNIVRVLLAFSRQKKLYDPLKRVYFRMKVEDKIRG